MSKLRLVSVLVLLFLVTALPLIAQEPLIEANGGSFSSYISDDGRFVIYTSTATNLVGGVPIETRLGELYIFDRNTENTKHLTLPSIVGNYSGIVINQPSANLQFVPIYVFTDGENSALSNMFVIDRGLADDDQLIPLNMSPDGIPGDRSYPFETPGNAVTVSDDGRWMLYMSSATNLLSDDPNDDGVDLYLFDRETNALERVFSSRSSSFPEGALFDGVISGDGRYIALSSWDGSVEAFSAIDTNNTEDIFLYDRETETFTFVSLNLEGQAGNDRSRLLSISHDGRLVWFQSDASDLVENDTNNQTDLFLYDRETDSIERISIGDNGQNLNGYNPVADITPDGHYVVFGSLATNVFEGIEGPDFANIYRLDRETGEIMLVSRTQDGGFPERPSFNGSISDDGRYISFQSLSDDIVPNDNNGVGDIFLFDAETEETVRISVPNQ